MQSKEQIISHSFLEEKACAVIHLAPVLMTYIMGIRFLADYLRGDIYYKTSFAGHNMVRSRVQQKLIREMEASEHIMKQVISKALT